MCRIEIGRLRADFTTMDNGEFYWNQRKRVSMTPLHCKLLYGSGHHFWAALIGLELNHPFSRPLPFRIKFDPWLAIVSLPETNVAELRILFGSYSSWLKFRSRVWIHSSRISRL